MYHLRLEDAKQVYFPTSKDPLQQMALRALAASSLYSDNLSGLVVLLDRRDFSNYALGQTANVGESFLLSNLGLLLFNC